MATPRTPSPAPGAPATPHLPPVPHVGRKKAAIGALAAACGHPVGGDLLWGRNRLTVLVYHRVLDHAELGTCDPDVVSADTAAFERQMEYVARHFSVISMWDLDEHLTASRPLPPRPLLVTFDDGYADNLHNALPVLRRLGLPSVVFLATGFIDRTMVPWWDALADVLARAPSGTVELPLIGVSTLTGKDANRDVRAALLAGLKNLDDASMRATMDEIAHALGVAPQLDDNLFVDWDGVRRMVDGGMACQPHTVTHPILTKVTPEQVARELAESARVVAQHTGQPSRMLAYPNGSYDPTVMGACRDAGLSAAFTMELGPGSLRDARRQPFEIPRVSISAKDDWNGFRLKVHGGTLRILQGATAARAAVRRARPVGRASAP